ncbi:Cell surface protein with gram positive anchor [Bifidobacterium longum subsp. longum]|uniref:Cell surface protein with gram positive anchor n=1 Tax=Bifidobacterium longum subsp. longum TaxID=1679 RepID=A0AB38IBE5_BIFLL|nr:SpaH/EbpB family LPXTG-anchored major pilin [Bifidobacterium longum]TCD99159.1 Cell surface protein with gram positive anchor and Cna protein B-type domains [Bifidobacterium longum subsp. longum]TCE38642.1 Cell surface protein with gram positive anchor [Bifidobacterium longum subsp. longum]TCE49114.1 Cell surface protein with gram positive anchor [Bifidobacterium longum subsp. longum]TCE71821.1 Cell surface protein with gram positive anchor [Bifidobacterium longum subsp. longum]TCE77414.1 C
MKSLMKKVFAAAAAIATVFGLAATTVATANAADGATLTVSTADAKFVGKTVNAYKMFSATVGGEGANKAVSYTLTDTWKPFFMDSTASGLNGATDANVNDKANEYVSELAGDNLVAFATKASNWAQTQAKNITADKTATVSAGATNGNYTATFTGLDYGYYVVAVPGATLANTSGQYATLVSVDSTNVNANIKGSLPTVDKKVQVNGNGADTADAKIGDTLTFTLTSTIPDMSAYDTYTFNFKDTLSKGLTYGDITSVTVEGVDAPLVKDTDYTVTTTPAAAGNTLLTVGMTDFKNKQQTNAGKKITVTYTATLNENAVVGGAGNVNSATIQYSNDPSSTGTGESEPDKVRVFTYGFTVDKYTGDNYNDAATRLAGAEFTLTAKGDTSAIKFVQVNAGSATEDAVYRVAKAGKTAGTTTTITTPANGKVVFQGLKNGEYTLTETKAPAGYNKLASAIGVKVNGSNDGTDTTNATVNITYNNDNNDTTYDQTASNGVIPVQNKSGAILPGTGGMGTIAFTVIGVLVIALGVAWTLKRKNA